MKTLFKTFAYATIAALALSSCAKEKLQPADELTGKLVTVHFGTENTDPSTKATLTPDAGETAFQAAWENNDVLSVHYINGNNDERTVSAIWNGSKFSAELPEYTGKWVYKAAYPVPDATDHVDFGSNRTQKGNAYNSKYDIMIGSAVAEGADAGKDAQGNDIIFEMDRQTAIAYFHFTSDIDESLVSATLKVTDGAIANSAASITDFKFVAPLESDEKEIKLTFEDGTAPSAKDFQLWFNVLPKSYSSMTLTVETDTKTFTISRNSKGLYEAGKLYKVKKDGISWTDKGGSSETVYAYKKIYAQSELTDGSYLIVSDDYKFAVAGSKTATDMIKGGAGTNIDITNDIVNYSSNLALDAFEINSTPEGYSIKGSKCGYIGYSLDSNSGLQGSSTTVYNNSINIVGGVATITTMNNSNTTYTLCCNPNNGTPLVKYYITVNEKYVPISLYKYQEVDPTQVPTLYNVIINSVVGGTLSATPASAEAGTEISLTATPDAGYVFNNDWTVTAADNSSIEVAEGKFRMPAQDVTVSGSFSKFDYTITKVDSEGGSFTVKNNGVAVTKAQIGETITLEATAEDGYEFDSWTVTNESTSKTVYVSENSFTMPGANVTVKANFVELAVVPVYASLEELVQAGTPTSGGTYVTVTLTNDEITKIYTTSNGYRNGIFFIVGSQEVEIYCRDVPETWVVGGCVSGTLKNCAWKLFNSTWELCPTDWTELTYAAPCETPVILSEDFASLKKWGSSSKTSFDLTSGTWTASGSVYEQNGCIKIGKSSNASNSITTPALSSISGTADVVLTFKAVSSDSGYTMSVVANNAGTVGELSPSSITKHSTAINDGSSTADALAEAFAASTATFTVTITGATSATTLTIKTSGTSRRWYLDDVKVVSAN